MKRYYRCPLVKDSKGRNVPSIALSDEWINRTEGEMQTITSDFVNGVPIVPWCMCAIEFKDHAALGKLEGVEQWPDFPLDAKVGSMHGPTKLALRAQLLAAGVDVVRVFDTADGFRDVLNKVARDHLNNPGFEADSF